MIRLTRDAYFANLVQGVAMRGSCVRRKTGCILVDQHYHIIGTGYNGRPRGFVECLNEPCQGAYAASGTALEQCEAIHSEINALIQCKNTEEIMVAYCTTAPCIHCVKALLNTSCKRIAFLDDYPHSEVSRKLCETAKVNWHHLPPAMSKAL